MLSLLFGMLNIGAILYLSEGFMYLFLVNILSFSLKCQLQEPRDSVCFLSLFFMPNTVFIT